VPVLFSGHKLPPLVEIGLTDLPKFGGAMAPLAPPGTTGLTDTYSVFFRLNTDTDTSVFKNHTGY
jgi:hypothetical protein